MAEKDILLAKDAENKIWAFDEQCTHADRSLEKGHWNPVTAEITCPFHKAVFCVSHQGAVKKPPACVPLPVYPVHLQFENGEDIVYVECDD